MSDMQFLLIGMALGAALCLMVQSCQKIKSSYLSGAKHPLITHESSDEDPEDPNLHVTTIEQKKHVLGRSFAGVQPKIVNAKARPLLDTDAEIDSLTSKSEHSSDDGRKKMTAKATRKL
jgi:hypothetical protein